jgi:peptide/nickel transport system permease protein
MATEVCRDTVPRLTGPAEHGYACHHPAVTVSDKELTR